MDIFTTAAVVTLASGALAGATVFGNQLKQAPPDPMPIKEAPPTAPPEPVAEPVPTPPSESEDPAPLKGGGGIGVPPWGVITNVSPLGPSPVGSISAAFASSDPKALKDLIIKTNQELEEAEFRLRGYEEDYVKSKKKYTDNLSIAAKYQATAELIKEKIEFYKRQLKPKQAKLSDQERAALQKQLENTTDEGEKKKIRQKLSGNPGNMEKELDIEQAKPIFDAIEELTQKKVIEEEAKRDSEKESTRLLEKREGSLKRRDDQDKLVKELRKKLDDLLKSLQDQQIKSPGTNFPDWEARTNRYTDAVKKRRAAEEAFRVFYAQSWLPLKGLERQKSLQVEFDRLKKEWEDSKASEAKAKAGLTSTASIVSSASSSFLTFVQDIDELLEGKVDSVGNPLPNFQYQARPTPQGYSPAVKDLKVSAKIPTVQSAADIYYEISHFDTTSLIVNRRKYIDLLKRVRVPQFRRFLDTVLPLAENAQRFLPPGRPGDDLTESQQLYADIREKTNIFVDTQYSYIKKMFSTLRAANKTVSAGSIESKDLLELDGLLSPIFKLRAGVPPAGICSTILPAKTYKYLSEGEYKGKNLLELLSKEESADREEFLKEIGFERVTSFLEAKQLGLADVGLLRSAYLTDYLKAVERLAAEDPNGTRAGADSARIKVEEVNRMDLATLNALDVNFEAIQIVQHGDPMSNAEFAAGLRSLVGRETNNSMMNGYDLAVPVPANGRRALTRVPISTVKDSCELDGNVGYGKELSAKIVEILSKIERISTAEKQLPNPLVEFIGKLESRRIIDLRRADQARATSILGNRGFPEARFANSAIIKVSERSKTINFVEAFLTLRSSKFRSIPYDAMFLSKNARQMYAELALSEILKKPSFSSKEVNARFSKGDVTDEDWQRLGDDFNLNFVLFKEGSKKGTVNFDAAERDAATVYFVFKSKDDKYFPVFVQPATQAVGGPTGDRSVPRGPIAQYPGDMLGGWVEGPEFNVEPDMATRRLGLLGEEILAAPANIGIAVPRAVGQVGRVAQGVGQQVGRPLGLGPLARNDRRVAAEAALTSVNNARAVATAPRPEPPTLENLNFYIGRIEEFIRLLNLAQDRYRIYISSLPAGEKAEPQAVVDRIRTETLTASAGLNAARNELARITGEQAAAAAAEAAAAQAVRDQAAQAAAAEAAAAKALRDQEALDQAAQAAAQAESDRRARELAEQQERERVEAEAAEQQRLRMAKAQQERDQDPLSPFAPGYQAPLPPLPPRVQGSFPFGNPAPARAPISPRKGSDELVEAEPADAQPPPEAVSASEKAEQDITGLTTKKTELLAQLKTLKGPDGKIKEKNKLSASVLIQQLKNNEAKIQQKQQEALRLIKEEGKLEEERIKRESEQATAEAEEELKRPKGGYIFRRSRPVRYTRRRF